MEIKRVVLGQDISMRADLIGDDLTVCCFGGHTAHIGAVSIAMPYVTGTGIRSASVSTVVVPSHREDEMSRQLAGQFCKAIGRTVSVICGIHYDNIRKEDISVIESEVRTLAQELLTKICQVNCSGLRLKC